MIVTFCHRDFSYDDFYRDKFIDILKNLAEKNNPLVFYCGGYGKFDRFGSGNNMRQKFRGRGFQDSQICKTQ